LKSHDWRQVQIMPDKNRVPMNATIPGVSAAQNEPGPEQSPMLYANDTAAGSNKRHRGRIMLP